MTPYHPLGIADLVDLFATTPNLLHWCAAFLGLLLGATAIATAVIPAVRHLVLTPLRCDKLSAYLPFDSVLEDGSTLRSPDGDLTVTLTLDGLDPGSMSLDDRMALARRRCQWVDVLAGRGVKVKVLSRRRRLPIDHDPIDLHPVRREILRRQYAPFQRALHNRHYVVLTIQGAQDRARDTLEECVDQTMQILEPFGPRRLVHDGPLLPAAFYDGLAADPALRESELLTFWGSIVNPTLMEPIGAYPDALATRLATCAWEIDFATGLMEFGAGDRTVYAKIVTPSQWGSSTSESMVARLLCVNAEIIILQTFNPASKAQGEFRVSRRADMVRGGRDLSSLDEQADVALNMVAGGTMNQTTFVDYGMSVLVMGTSPEEVRLGVNDVRRVFIDYGITPVVEVDAAEYIWFRQLPTYEDHPREMGFFSHNLADLLSFESVSPGLPASDWGPRPVMIFPTVQGTPHRFNFHNSAEDEGFGHTLIFGPPGKGKTSTACQLATGALDANPNLRVFYFDRGFGALVWTLAAGGKYLTLQNDVPGIPAASLNPLLREPNDVNAAHLRNWLRMLTGIANDAEAEEQYGAFIRDWRAAPVSARKLETLAQTAIPEGSRVRAELAKWIDPNQYGRVYNGAADACEFGDNRIVTFDMTTCLEDSVLAPSLVIDLFHLIKSTADREGCPILIIIDETIALLRHPIFQAKYLEAKQEIRKKHGVIVSMFQRPSAVRTLDSTGVLAEALRNLSATLIFFRDEGAEAADYDQWQLVEREKRFIKGDLAIAARADRAMLVKKPALGESVYLNVHNGRLGDYAMLFKSGAEFARAAIETAAAVPPEGFVRAYLDRVNLAAAAAGRRSDQSAAAAAPAASRRAA